VDIGDTVKRIDGTEVPLTTPWLGKAVKPARAKAAKSEKAAPAAETTRPEKA
jgi:NADH-quinone oxidoreductase subunit E